MVESRVTGHAQVSSVREIHEHRRHEHRDRSVLSWQACPVIELNGVRESTAWAIEWSRVTGHARVSSSGKINEHRRHGHRDRSSLWQACPVIELNGVRESTAWASNGGEPSHGTCSGE